MIEHEPSPEAIHRTVSNHVLKFIPVTPKRAESLTWPLGFLTARCKDASKDIQTDYQFTKSEIRVSEKILPWEAMLDIRFRDQINELKQERYTKGEYEGKPYFPPLVIRAKSGFGKSILLGKVVAELIDSKFFDGSNEWRTFDRIVFSQLKDQTGASLEYAICNGMDDFHQCEDLETFFDKTKAVSFGRKVLLIDSLDEHTQRKLWWKISERLSAEGWMVVWSCRDPDWDHHELGEEPYREHLTKPAIGKERKPSHWDRFTGFDWTLELGDARMAELNPIINESQKSTNNVKQFVKYCYSKTQLMHIYHTNFDMRDAPRRELDRRLLETLLEVREYFRTRAVIENEFLDPDFYHGFFDANLAKIIIDTAINFLDKEDYDARLAWQRLCGAYHRNRSKNRKKGQLDESLSFTEEDNIPQAFIQRLKLFGILREGRKFRHRDFATIAYVTGCKNGLAGLRNEQNDILLKHFFPYTVLDNTGALRENESDAVIDDFLRRTGNMMSQLKIFDKETDIPKNIIAQMSDLRKDDSAFNNKGLSSSQKRSLKLGEIDICTVLHGVPGSGKTYSGVEFMLVHQAQAISEGRTDSNALIVALNKQLAKSIEKELKRQHRKSPLLSNFEEKKENIFRSIKVKSLDEVLEEWLPEETVNFSKKWKMELSNIFAILETKPRLKVERKQFRWLEEAFQKHMFDRRTGSLTSKETFLQRTAINENLDQAVCSAWYDEIKRQKENGRMTIIEACTLLRNRLLRYEHYRSKEVEWNSDYGFTKEGSTWEQNKEFNRYAKLQFYDFIMIDEVQDLPEMAVQMLSFLSPNRKGKAFVLAGDKLQTLNGRPFDWKKFLDALTDMTKLLATDHAHIYHSKAKHDEYRPTHHHLRGLYWSDTEVRDVIQHHLNENHRNHPGISNVARLSWEKWPSAEYYEEVKNSYPLEKMESKYAGLELNNPNFSPLMIVESKNAEDFNEKAKIILRFLNARAKVSLLYTNDTIRDYISKKVMKDDQKIVDKLSVESFTPWTIKGLERDAVVIFGAYTASANDTDTTALWGQDFTRLGQYSTLDKGVKSAIDLMRRKMIVANTRAVEQLVVVNLPREETNLANQKQYRIKSLQPPKFSSQEVGYKIEFNDDRATLKEDLKRFFKESKIKTEHVSMARLSEGLNIIMRARDEPELKEEFEFFRSSLKTILEDDVPDSVLREVLSSVLNNPSDCNLNKLTVINDLLQLDESKLSFNADVDGAHDVQNNHYSDMIKQYHLLKSSPEGPWSNTGIECLRSVLYIMNKIDDNMKNSKQSRELRHQAAHETEILDDIENLHDNLSTLIHRFGSSLGLPKSKLNEKELIVYLFSEQCDLNLENAEYGQLTEPTFALKILQSFGRIGRDIKFDELGILVYVMEEDDNELSGHLKIRLDVWDKFTKDLSALEFEGPIQSEFTTYAVRLVKMHHDFLVSQSSRVLAAENRKPVSADVLTQINSSNASAMNYLVSLGNQNALDECIEQLVEFIKTEFKGMEEDISIKNFLKGIISTKPSILNEYIEDKDVISFHFKNFNLFTNALKSATLPQFVDRARRLFSKADYVNRLLSRGFVSIQSLDSSIYNAGKILVHKVNEEDTFSDYETLIGGIKRDILKGLMENPRHLEIDAQAATQWKNMSVLNRLISLAGLNFGNNFDLDTKIFDKLSDEYIQSVVDNLDAEINHILAHELRLEESSTSLMVENLLRNILFAQQLVNRYPNAKISATDNVAQFPVLQQSGIYQLDSVTEYPNYFAPDFGDEKEEAQWVQGNKSLKFFTMQRERIEHMKLIANMQKNWDVQVKLYSALFDHEPKFIQDRLAWRFDGFGELMAFSEWMDINKQIRSGTRSEENLLSHVLILNEEIDFSTRIKNYLRVIEAYLQVLESRNTKTIGLKILLQESLSKIFSLREIINSKGIDYDLELKAFPQGKELTVTIKKNGKLKVDSWAKDVPDFIQLTRYLGLKGDKLNRENIIVSLKQKQEVLQEYLDLEIKEIRERTESAQHHGNLVIDGANNIEELLANVSREIAKESVEKTPILETEEDWSHHADSLGADELGEFVEAPEQEFEEFENNIGDEDLPIIKRFNLSKEDWAGMEAERKEFYRNEFERLG